MKHFLWAALAAMLCGSIAWADEPAPGSTQISGTITDIVPGANIITVTPSGEFGAAKGAKGLGIQEQAPPPKKGGGEQVPLKGGETPIQDPGQVPLKTGGEQGPLKGGETPVQDPGQVPPKKGSKAIGEAAGISMLVDKATAIHLADKPVGFDALQIGQHVQVTYAPLITLVDPVPLKSDPVPGKTEQAPLQTEPAPPSKVDPGPAQVDPIPGKTEPAPGPVEQVPAKAGADGAQVDPAPAVQAEEPAPGSKGLGKVDGKSGPEKVQFRALAILILPQEPIQSQKQGPAHVPSKTGGVQNPPQQIQQQAPLPRK